MTAATVARRSWTVLTAEVDRDVDLPHLSRLLAADARAVLLRPVDAVVNVRTERIRELSVATLALLAENVRGLEVVA